MEESQGFRAPKNGKNESICLDLVFQNNKLMPNLPLTSDYLPPTASLHEHFLLAEPILPINMFSLISFHARIAHYF